jgi:hypothetical protein
MPRKKTFYYSGEIAQVSGIYQIVGPRGGHVGGMQRMIKKGAHFPPTPEAGQKYRLVVRSKTSGK